MTRPAVVSAGWIASTGPDAGRVRLPGDGTNLVDIARAAIEMGCSTAFLFGWEGFLADSQPWPPTDQVQVVVSGPPEGGPDDAWRWRVSGDGWVVQVVDLGNDLGEDSGPWAGLSARDLWLALRAFERQAGVPWASSVGLTAERLVLSTHPRSRGGVVLDADPVMPEPALDTAMELPWQPWRRELAGDELRAGYVHAFDANAQYLAAWGAVELGHGTPVHHVAPRFDASRAGMWRITAPPHNPEPLLPPAWLDGREWFTTPTVVRMLEVCEGFDAPMIVEAWVWPRRSRFLRGASERLRDARAAAMAAQAEARAARDGAQSESEGLAAVARIVTTDVVSSAVKLLYARETGRFNMPGRDPRSGWARPDWGHTVRATARCNLHRRLAKLGRYPFGVDVDGLLFADDEPDGLKFAERIGLPIGTGLGQFRHDGTAPAADILGVEGRGLRPIFRAIHNHRIEVPA